MLSEDDEFELAAKAFSMFTLAGKRKALERFKYYRCESATERFFAAVHDVISERDEALTGAIR